MLERMGAKDTGTKEKGNPGAPEVPLSPIGNPETQPLSSSQPLPSPETQPKLGTSPQNREVPLTDPGDNPQPKRKSQKKDVPTPEGTPLKDTQTKVGNGDYDREFSPENAKIEGVIDIDNAADFLAFVDPEINEGRVTPYKWQFDQLREMSDPNISDDNPYLLAMPAANGSGKDKYIIAPLAVWALCCKYKARTIITTSSGTQLTRQTEPYMRQLCGRVNELFGDGFIRVRQRHMTCETTGSEIVMFATDEGGQAEGYHPWEKGSWMLLIVNEAKSVAPEIFQAIERCTGYTHQIFISSPGEPSGDFYKAYTSGLYKTRKVTAFHCPHIKQRDIDKTAILYGKSSPLFRSKILAEFTSIGSLVVIPIEQYERCIKEAKEIDNNRLGRRAGIDLAAGGDETVISVFQGNKQIALEGFHTPDTVEGVDMIVRRLEAWELEPSNVYADDGGVGRSIIDQIWRRKRNKGGYWLINRVLNQSPAVTTSEYGNRGAELYFNFQRLIQESLVVLIDDPKQKTQLTTRKYKQGAATGKLTLQSKADARAEGMESPDRADATVLAFTGITVLDLIEYKNKSVGKGYAYHIKTQEETPKGIYTDPYKDFSIEGTNSPSNKRCFMSLGRLLNIN